MATPTIWKLYLNKKYKHRVPLLPVQRFNNSVVELSRTQLSSLFLYIILTKHINKFYTHPSFKIAKSKEFNSGSGKEKNHLKRLDNKTLWLHPSILIPMPKHLKFNYYYYFSSHPCQTLSSLTKESSSTHQPQISLVTTPCTLQTALWPHHSYQANYKSCPYKNKA